MQSTIRQRRHLEHNSLRHAEPMKADKRISDVITTSQVENEPCCNILDNPIVACTATSAKRCAKTSVSGEADFAADL